MAGRDIRSISLCVRLRWRVRTASKNAVLPRRSRHCRQAFCLINDVEHKNAVRLVRAQQGERTIFTGSHVNGPGHDDLACKAVFATRAQSSRVSVNNDNGMQGSLCHKGAVIAGKLLCLRSKPTAVTAKEGTDIVGELLVFLFLSAGQQLSQPTRTQTSRESYNFFFFCQRANSGHGRQGHRHRRRATNFFTASRVAVAPQGL